MADTFHTFKRFRQKEIATDLIQKLQELNIEFEIEDGNKFQNLSPSRDAASRDIGIKLKPKDFIIAERELENYYRCQTEQIDPGYYLFDFSDKELQEIVENPGGWEDFDYQLAQKILKNKEKELNAEPTANPQEEQDKPAMKRLSPNKRWIYFGYLAALLGGLPGIIFGWYLYYNKKTMPDGGNIYSYGDWERMHGKFILLLGSIFLPIWLMIKIIYQPENY